MVPIGGRRSAADLNAEFSERYSNAKTRHQYVAELSALFASTGRVHPADLREAEVLSWCGGAGKPVANNTIRNRLSRVITFVRWCVRVGEADAALVEALADRDNPLCRIPRLYGKVQGKNPARWLTYDEAYRRLLASCQAEGLLGLRDELVLRFGLSGMRASEIINVRIGDLHLTDDPPQIRWIGKARRPRRIVVGSGLSDVLSRYLAAFEGATGCTPPSGARLVRRGKPGNGIGQVSWGNPIARTCSIQRIVAIRAAAAGLGHLSPHDLRRSAAGILHRAKGTDGGHLFDLRDIQQVLDHADPATTQRSYLDPLDTRAKELAARYLD